MKGVKGFNKDLTCRGFQYKEGETFKTPRAKACEEGFHFCENPIDCLNYYSPAYSVYHEVEGSGNLDFHNEDSKVACTEIKIGAKIDIPHLCKATFDYVKSKCTNKHNAKPGEPAVAGEHEAATAGYKGAATSRGSVEVGKNGVGTVRGENVKIKGGLGAALMIAIDTGWPNYTLVEWKAFVVDGEEVKADTWYTLKDGKLVEV